MRRCLAALLLLAGPAQAAGPVLLLPAGAVELRSGEGPWSAVSERTPLSLGQEVRTGAASGAEVRFPDGSKILLSPNSQFRMDQSDAKQTIFTLSLGKLRAAFAGLISSRISIKTPDAVCSVRGTVFDLGAGPGHTEVSMAEGVLEVKDNKGRQAVVTSEETLKIDQNGLGQAHLVALNDERALPAVRPLTVHQEMARDATRVMLEDLRHRELKANEAQLGKDVIDAFGRRVRLDEYLLRPDNQSFKILFLASRQDRFDWGHLTETFNSRIPDDLSQVPAIISGTFLSRTKPANWLTGMEFYATNTIDAEKEVVALGNPVQINFAGYGPNAGFRWYPQSIDFTQTLYGPGVPGGARVQFNQHQDWSTTNPGYFTWTQSAQAGPAGSSNLQEMVRVALDPTTADPANPFSVYWGGGVIGGGPGDPTYDNTNTVTSSPSGPGKADFKSVTTYADNSTVAVEKFLVNDNGKIYSSGSPDFTQNGSYNLELNIKSNLFQGRDIDVLIAPEILQQQKTQTTTVSSLQL